MKKLAPAALGSGDDVDEREKHRCFMLMKRKAAWEWVVSDADEEREAMDAQLCELSNEMSCMSYV